MSRWRAGFVVVAVALLALALTRRGGAVTDLADEPTARPSCATCAGVHAAPPVEAIDGPDTATVLASLGYEVLSPHPMATTAIGDPGDEGWTRPIAVASVRRLPIARVASAGDAAKADAPRAAPTPSAGATRSGASTAPRGGAASPADAAIPVGPSVAGAERLVRDGVVLIEAGSLCGTPIRAADGKVRVTNISSGPYSVMFLDPVKVDGLTIPASTELPVDGQLEIEIARDSRLIILPHASAWPTTPAPTGDG